MFLFSTEYVTQTLTVFVTFLWKQNSCSKVTFQEWSKSSAWSHLRELCSNVSALSALSMNECWCYWTVNQMPLSCSQHTGLFFQSCRQSDAPNRQAAAQMLHKHFFNPQKKEKISTLRSVISWHGLKMDCISSLILSHHDYRGECVYFEIKISIYLKKKERKKLLDFFEFNVLIILFFLSF